MLRTLVVCGALVAVVVLLFSTGAGSGAPARHVDVTGPTRDAGAAGLHVRAPRVPGEWRASSARYAPDTTEGLPTWHVGWVTGSGSDAEVDVARGGTPTWVDGVIGDQESGGDGAPSRSVDGVRWSVRSADVDGHVVHALVRSTGSGAGVVTTVVSGHAARADLDALAAAVVRAGD